MPEVSAYVRQFGINKWENVQDRKPIGENTAWDAHIGITFIVHPRRLIMPV